MRQRMRGIVITLLGGMLAALLSAAQADSDVRRRAHMARSNELNVDDIRAEISFGREIAARVFGREPLYDHAELTRYVSLVGNALALNSSRPELQFYFAVLDSPLANAYSAPGGYVFITRGALKKMTSETELAAVLAHEIAHVQQRHIVNALNIRAQEDNKLGAWMAALVGGSGETAKVAFFQAVDKATDLLFVEGFNIRDELDSDRVALLLLANTGYDPGALRSVLQRVDADIAITPKDAKRTHPSSAERMSVLNESLQKSGMTPTADPRWQQRFTSHEQYF